MWERLSDPRQLRLPLKPISSLPCSQSVSARQWRVSIASRERTPFNARMYSFMYRGIGIEYRVLTTTPPRVTTIVPAWPLSILLRPRSDGAGVCQPRGGRGRRRLGRTNSPPQGLAGPRPPVPHPAARGEAQVSRCPSCELNTRRLSSRRALSLVAQRISSNSGGDSEIVQMRFCPGV